MGIERKQIIQTLNRELKNNSHVYAFWLEGSEATKNVDEYSDLDFWFDVKDGKERHIAKEAKKIISQLAPIDFEHEMPKPHPKIRHFVLHLEGTPETLIIDLCIQSHSRKFVFTKGLPEHKIKVIIDKNSTIKYRSFNKSKHREEIKARIEELEKTYAFFYKSYFSKNLLRKNFLESLFYYQRYVLEPLVEIYRIRYCPMKKDFYFKHASRDLPKNILKNIEDLYKVKSVEQIKAKSKKAKELFFKNLNSIKKTGLK